MIKNSARGIHSGLTVFYKILSSPLGDLALIWVYKDRDPAIIEIQLPRKDVSLSHELETRYPGAQEKMHPSLTVLAGQMRAFLEGDVMSFSFDFLDWDRCYEFQRRVLRRAFEIPRGKIATYGGLAEKIGVPRAARAVGNAMAQNPFPLVLPCHRVIKSTGHLGNFGGGIELKRALLSLEGVEVDRRNVVDHRFFWE